MMALRQWMGAGRERVARCGPIGVELAAEKLHMVQLERSEGAVLSVRAHASVPFPARRAAVLDSSVVFRKMLDRALRCDRFKGRRAVLALPPREFRTLAIAYRLEPGQHEADVIAALAARRLGCDAAKLVVDFAPLPGAEEQGERRALVAVSSRERVVRHLELARLAGLRVDALETGPAAIRRLVSALPGDDELALTLVVNTGRYASYLTTIGASSLLLDEPVQIGEEQLLDRLSAALGVSAAQARRLALGSMLGAGDVARRHGSALAQRRAMFTAIRSELECLADAISRACKDARATSHGAAVTRVYLLGSLARWPGMCEALNRLAPVTITLMPNPLSLFGGDEDFADATADPLAPELAVATGLALRGLEVKPAR